ncbi:hypothetical protein NliqN6_5605 [Naganishia liquefaciens]|uniref:Exocyst complex component Sec3 PIP2-binding N-terminal domain-containing protein n=1 Tax=Naganishia liquefaciens TaxID=104408 RepID=A0A8H3TY40_9TREE|nr:hypothetical protein NliqN6_5605 [Naganishia liquefaciens]
MEYPTYSQSPPSGQTMASAQPISTRQQIIDSLFSKITPDGQREETLITHLKVWEDGAPDTAVGPTDIDGRKTRYLLLAVSKTGRVYLHKAKRNSNQTFSKGKTWNLEDLRAVRLEQADTFALTMTSRSYSWHCESPHELYQFLQNLLKVYVKYTRGNLPQLSGIEYQETQSPNFLSPSNKNVSLPVQQSLQPPLMQDRKDSASSQGSGVGSGYGSTAPSHRTGSGSVDHTAQMRSSPQERRMYFPESRQSPSPGPANLQQNLSVQKQPSVQQSQTMEQENSAPSVSHTRQRTADHEISQAPQPVPSKTLIENGHSGSSKPQRNDYATDFTREQGSSGSKLPLPGSGQSTLHRDASTAPPQANTSVSRRNEQTRARSPSPPPSMTVEPPTPIPGDVATMETIQGARPFENDRQPSRDVSPQASRGNVETPEPSHSLTAGALPPASNATKQRARLAPIVTSTNDAEDTAGKSKPSSEVHAPESKPAEPIDRVARMRRASFHPSVQPTAGYSRDVLLRSSFAVSGTAGALLEDPASTDKELEDETLANVEELLEGFDWGSVDIARGEEYRVPSTTEVFESRLLDELNALEAANIHAFLESDDRIATVLSGIDEALLELDAMDTKIMAYKLQLTAVSDDIAYIESQNRGLQVQTANQRALLNSIEQLMQISRVNPDELRALTQASLETEKGITSLEHALSSLYKALLVGRVGGEMAATIERTQEYETNNRQFCSRLSEYLLIMFKFQCEMALSLAADALKTVPPEIPKHAQLEDKLGKYCGLVLYMKEMDEERYQKLCANYFSTVSDLHSKEVVGYLGSLTAKLKRPTDEDKQDGSFAAMLANQANKGGAINRSKTMMDNLRRNDTKKVKRNETGLNASQAFESALQQISTLVTNEEAFIGDFLHTSDTAITFADYMDMEFYFKRQAANQAAVMSPATLKLRRSAMDLIFGFLDGELKKWIEAALQRESIQVFGMMASCEKVMIEQEDSETVFFANIMQYQAQRLQQLVDKFMAEQIRAIEATKLTVKKRKGVIGFVRHFPTFVERIEQQLVGAEDSSTRDVANAAYEQVLNTMLDTLQQMAKLDRTDMTGTGDDKSQLNYFIIMIENMHVFVADITKLGLAVLNPYLEKAQSIYDENMNAYINAVLRRSFGKSMDFFDGVQRQLQTLTPQEVTASPAYNKSALKRAVKDISSQKELRKALEALAKRIEKHYSIVDEDGNELPAVTAVQHGGAEIMISTVWSACERILVDAVKKWQSTMATVYSDAASSGVGLEYGPAEVDSLFKKLKPV